MKNADLWGGERAVVEQDKAKYHTFRIIRAFPFFSKDFLKMKYHSENIASR